MREVQNKTSVFVTKYPEVKMFIYPFTISSFYGVCVLNLDYFIHKNKLAPVYLRLLPLFLFFFRPTFPRSPPHQSPSYHSVIGHDHQGPQLNGDPLLENYPVTC